ncbi:MAG: 4-hydroxythreonine-4-phosphate dehydrogenase PdxA [Cyanobacteria bacterium P01_C01_bin.121]
MTSAPLSTTAHSTAEPTTRSYGDTPGQDLRSTAPHNRPRLVMTLGDPAGIGPEIVLKTLSNPSFEQQAEITVIGDRTLLYTLYTQLTTQNPKHPLRDPDTLKFIDIDIDPAITTGVISGIGNSSSGEVAFRTLQSAIAHTLKGEFDGIVTAPIAKSAWLAAGHHYPGQTELLAEMSEATRFGMLFVAKSPKNQWSLRTLLATTHIPLKEVPQALTPDVMTLKLELLIECLQRDFGLKEARIAIAGLNPHSGEQGQLGREEQDWLIPWMQAQQQRFPHIQLDGPIPPDTLWVQPGLAWHSENKPTQNQAHDGYLALYHDQGLIPVKLLAFDLAVNTTIGLPFIRTSPDHGTAFNIAGQGIARSQSTEAALELAIELTTQRLLKKQATG